MSPVIEYRWAIVERHYNDKEKHLYYDANIMTITLTQLIKREGSIRCHEESKWQELRKVHH